MQRLLAPGTSEKPKKAPGLQPRSDGLLRVMASNLMGTIIKSQLPSSSRDALKSASRFTSASRASVRPEASCTLSQAQVGPLRTHEKHTSMILQFCQAGASTCGMNFEIIPYHLLFGVGTHCPAHEFAILV